MNEIDEKYYKTPGVAKILLGMYIFAGVVATLVGMYELKASPIFSVGYLIVFILGLPWSFFVLSTRHLALFTAPLFLNAVIWWSLLVWIPRWRHRRSQ